MKFFLTITITLFLSSYVFSQTKVIDKSKFLLENSEHKGQVKTIVVKEYNFQTLSDKKDTSVILKSYKFSKKNRLTTEFIFDKSIKKLYQIVEFYKNGEIKKISRNNNGAMITLSEQFFKNKNNHPFLVKEYDHLGIYGFYINTFKKNLVVKREHFIKGTLSEWNIYLYDRKNRLIEERYFSADNPTGELMKEKEKYSLTFYPEHLIEYTYKQHLDTIIEIKNRISINRKEVKKFIKKKRYSYEIIDRFKELKLNQRTATYKSKDSTSEKTIFFDDNGKIRSEYLSIKTPLLLISIIKDNDPFSALERKTFTKIDYEFDNRQNWIKKTYIQNGIIIKIVEREIEYYN